MKALALRLRAQKAEEAKVNMPALLKAWEDACDVATDIEKAIEVLPTTPNALAAKVMVLTAFGKSGQATFDGELASICVLETLRPNLSGLVGAYVERLLTTDLETPTNETFLTIGFLAPAAST